MKISRRRGPTGSAPESALANQRQMEMHAKMASRLASAAAVARDPELRQQMIATQAYCRAEGRGFVSGSELQDWLEAEKEIDQLLKASDRQETGKGASV